MLPLLVVPTLAIIAAQAVLCTIVVFLATPVLVYYLHHNFLRFLLRTKFFLMWTITSILMLMLVFELSVVPLLEILPEENLLFMICVVGGIWCGYRAKLNADSTAQEGAINMQGLELGEGSGDLCTMCRRRAPPKAHHCRLCQTCILNREYHCKWYNKYLCLNCEICIINFQETYINLSFLFFRLDCCIGSSNLRWYLGCLFFSAIAFIYGSNLTMTSVCHPFILIGTILLPDDCSDVYHQLEYVFIP